MTARKLSAKKIAAIVVAALLACTVLGGIIFGIIYAVREANPSPLSQVQRKLLAKRFEQIDFTPVTDVPKREISADKPLHVVTCYDGAEGVEELWCQIPDDIKPVTVLMLIHGNVFAPGGDPQALLKTADECERLGAPYAIQIINGETHAEWLMPLKWIEEEFCPREHFMGVSTAELYNGEEWRGQLDGDMALYVNDARRLAAKYGEFMIFTDTNIFGDNGTFTDWIEENEYLYDTLKECGKFVFMQNKESYGDPSSYSVMKGLYMAGLIGGWGVSTDWWHWQVDGKKVLFKEGRNNIDNEWERIYYYPESMQTMSVAMVAANGGFCFMNEADYYSVAVGGRRTATFEYSTIPFLRAVLQGRINIPSRAELLQAEKFAVLGAENYNAVNYDLKVSNLYPSDPGYGIIPLLPANLRAEEIGIFNENGVALIAEKLTEKNAAPFADSSMSGDTFMHRTGDIIFYVNNSENERAYKSAVCSSTAFTGVTDFSVGADEHTYLYAVQSENGIYALAGNLRLDKYGMVSALDGSEDPHDALAEWISVDPETGKTKAGGMLSRKITVSFRTSVRPVLENIAFYGQSDFEYKESYSDGVYTLEIAFNGTAEFDLRFSAGAGVTEEKREEDYSAAVYEYPDEEQMRALLSEKADVIENRSSYSDSAFAAFFREYSLINRALEEGSVGTERAEEAVEFLRNTPLTDLTQVKERVNEMIADGSYMTSGEQYDALLRAAFSPTKYYNYKEKQLRTYIWSRKSFYTASLYKIKTKEISAALENTLK